MSEKNPFEYQLGEGVCIFAGPETGVVIGRAQFAEADNSYFVRYVAADGRATEQWWSEQALDSVKA